MMALKTMSGPLCPPALLLVPSRRAVPGRIGGSGLHLGELRVVLHALGDDAPARNDGDDHSLEPATGDLAPFC